MVNRRSTCTLGTAALLCIAGVLCSQPSTAADLQPPAERPARATGTGPGTANPAEVRQMISRLLEERRASVARLEAAQQRLDGGADAGEIAKELMESFRENRRGGVRREGQSDDQAGGTAPQRPRLMELTPLGGPGPRLSPEERKKVQEFVDSRHPVIAAKVRSAQAEHPEVADRLIDSVGSRLRSFEAIRERNPEEFELRVQEVSHGFDVMAQGKAYVEALQRGAPEPELSGAMASLRQAMSGQVETKQRLSRIQLRQLLERAEQLKAQLDKNESEREAVVERRANELIEFLRSPRVPGAAQPKTDRGAKPETAADQPR